MLMEGYKPEEIELVYLTLAGAEPSEDSIKGLPDVVKENIKMGLLHFLTAHTKSAEKNFFFSALFFLNKKGIKYLKFLQISNTIYLCKKQLILMITLFFF